MTNTNAVYFSLHEEKLPLSTPLSTDAEAVTSLRFAINVNWRAGMTRALFYPIRTSSCRSLAKDLFLPLVVNFASKVQSTYLKYLSLILAFALDLAFLAVRCATLIPRIIYNASKKDHPLLTWLKERNYATGLWSAERIFVTIRQVIPPGVRIPGVDIRKLKFEDSPDESTVITETRWVNLIEIPE